MPRRREEQTTEMLVAEASVKPLINLVWAGLIILLVGVAVTIVRRAGDVARYAGSDAGALRPGSGDDPDAELVHEIAADVRRDPEEDDGRTGEQQKESR